MDIPAAEPETWRFGAFELRGRRELLRDGRPLAVGSRALAVLQALLRAQGAAVSKDELFRAAWPGRVVVENALHQQVRALRAALGDAADGVQTVARLGYRFAGRAERDASLLPQPVRPPLPSGGLLLRDAELRALRALVAAHRCVTLLGAGGVGKTRLVLELAQDAGPWPEGVFWCELGALEPGGDVRPALAAALAVDIDGGDPPPLTRLARALAGRRALLVLDNAEHVVEALAAALPTLLGAAGELHVLVSSQRPLAVAGERRLRLDPLAVPPAALQDRQHLARFGAVQFLLERVRGCGAEALAAQADAPEWAAALCRSLDGNPLALELVATRVAALGWRAVSDGMAERFALLAGGRRDRHRRHESLQALLDWSVSLLPAALRAGWEALSLFRDGWDLPSAQAVFGTGCAGPSAALAMLAELEERSLIVRVGPSDAVRWCMLELPHQHARSGLRASGHEEPVARRLLLHLVDCLVDADNAWDDAPDGPWLQAHRHRLDALAAALPHALAPETLEPAALALGHSARLWRSCGRVDELRRLLAHPLLEGVAWPRGVAAGWLQMARAHSLAGESCDARALCRAAVAAQREGGLAPLQRAQAALFEASSRARLGQVERQFVCLDRAETLLAGHRHGKVYAWLCDARAWAHQLRGELDLALRWAETAQAACDGVGAWLDGSRALLHRADLCLAVGDVAAALALGEQAVRRFQGGWNREDHGRSLANLGAAQAAAGRPDEAAQSLVASLRHLRGIDFSYWVFDHLAPLALAQGCDEAAAHMVGYADAGYRRHRQGRRLHNEAASHAAAMAELRARLPQRVLERALRQGAGTPEDDAIAWAEALLRRR